MRKNPELCAGLTAGGAPVMWERVIHEALPTMREMAPPESNVLEIGYGDGLLTCFLCRELGWRVVGLEVNPEAQRLAQEQARRFGLSDGLEFRCLKSEEVFRQQGRYDAVFVKTVLYLAETLEEYGRRLDWISSVLRPGGVLINFETGRANAVTQFYRTLRRRSYARLCLYTSRVEALYDSRFEIIERRYYGGLSQFAAPLPSLYHLAARLEEAMSPRRADNCFLASIIARRPG
jgi:predicted O-methyltransferase YrrM